MIEIKKDLIMDDLEDVIRRRVARLIEIDPFLAPYEKVLAGRIGRTIVREKELTRKERTLGDFASGHEYFGLHFKGNEWVFREWAPHATALCLVGDMTDWRENKSFRLDKTGTEGIWEIRLPASAMKHGDHYRLRVYWPEGSGDRIPAYSRRVVQDPHSLIFTSQVWRPPEPYLWRHSFKVPDKNPLLIYEAHVGMAQEEPKIGSYREFAEKVLPRIARLGYNTVQLMAVQEHPYYGSFGYQVSNFFAASSRFGTPEDLKFLIDSAHDRGIAIIMDIIHSHAVANEVEGLSRFDGTLYQYFHDGPRGRHSAWESRCFDYGKHQVIHFLLSNCRFWLDEYRFDGYRLDGVTSMIYLHHGLGKVFTSYDQYFDDSVEADALAYLALANKIVHQVRPDAITIAEDVSGMPGLALPLEDGGTGFDCRFAMGVPDYWIRLTKDLPEEAWPLGHLWFELTNRRRGERTVSYAESHDQALVGDQTLMFRLAGSAMYDHMTVSDPHPGIDRALALHKLIRLITLASADKGYLTFMGNEFGHPDWIDFPREGNDWSCAYARRQWSLVDDPLLKYRYLALFDADMIALVNNTDLLLAPQSSLLHEHSEDKVIAFERAGLVFAFNFHPTRSYESYRLQAPPGKYHIILDSDASKYGGHGRVDGAVEHFAAFMVNHPRGNHELSLYLPTRTALVLARA